MQLAGEALVGLDAVLGHRMFIPVEVELLQFPADFQGVFIDVIGAPRDVHQHHLRADEGGEGLTRPQQRWESAVQRAARAGGSASIFR